MAEERTAPTALSIDGRNVHLTAPVEADLRIGGIAMVPSDDTSALVVQLHDVRLADGEGPRHVVGEGVVLGTMSGDGFVRHDRTAAFAERPVGPATPDEIQHIAADLDRDVPSFEIGVFTDAPLVHARLRSKGFARHTFMCGQSGSGKTYTTGAIFERLLSRTTLPLVVLDPNSDHIHLDTLSDPTDASDDAARLRALASSVRIVRARGLPSSFTLCADFSDLPLEWQALLLRLQPVADADEFDALARLTAGLVAPYSVHDVLARVEALGADDPLFVRIGRRITNLGLGDWDVWRRGDERSITTMQLQTERCVVFDLGSLRRSDERAAVALALLGSRWAARASRHPVLIAIDEAHNVLPSVTNDPLLQAVTQLGVLIAGEGRKFGLHLFVATQRPAKVHPNVISQCDNLILMRMNGSGDIDELVSMFSHVPEPMVRQASTFGLGQALVAGPIAAVPAFVQVGRRLSPEGGSDVPPDWAT